MLKSFLVLLLGTAHIAKATESQVVLAPHSGQYEQGQHNVDEAILDAMEAFSDPVAAMIHLHPEQESILSEPRLLRVGGEVKPEWMTEGDKLRLRKQGKKFIDITEHADFYADQVHDLAAGKPRKLTVGRSRSWSLFNMPIIDLPDLVHESLIRPLFPKVDQKRMTDVLYHMTSYYNRYFGDIHGELSSVWLHNHVAQVS